MPSKPFAYSYVRMSTERQFKGDSLRRQLEWSQAYAAVNNLELDDSLRDIGVSAWKGKNREKGKLGEFIRRVHDGGIPSGSYLLVESLDRLSRMTVMDALDQFREILRAGIIVVTMGPPEQVYTWEGLNGDFGQLIITLSIMLRANEESERKSQRIRASFENKRTLSRLGVKTNQAPPSWITAVKVRRGEFEYALNENADTVLWIFERSAEGIGFDKIARLLNERGTPTFRKSKRGWWHSNVLKIVESRATIGEYQSLEERDGKYVPKGDPIPDYYPSVVTNNLFLRAQKIRHKNRKGGRAGTQFSNLFSGLARCAHCGSPMYMQNNSRSKYQFQYLVCSANWRQMRENSGKLVCDDGIFRFRYKQAEKLVLDNISEFGVSDLIQIQKVGTELQAVEEVIADLRMQLERLDRNITRLVEIIETEDAHALPDVVARLRTRRAERNEAYERLQRLTAEKEVLVAKRANVNPTGAIQAMRARWEDDSVCDEERYGLRVRCHTAMSEFIDQIDFNSKEKSYTLIMFGGLRAYRFFNVSNVRDLTQVPLMVDMTTAVLDQRHRFDADDAQRLLDHHVSIRRTHWRIDRSDEIDEHS